MNSWTQVSDVRSFFRRFVAVSGLIDFSLCALISKHSYLSIVYISSALLFQFRLWTDLFLRKMEDDSFCLLLCTFL
jgi:hypothetical protein